jgi:hypothetical protein
VSHALEAVIRRLFETFRLKVCYNRITDSLVVEVTIDARDFESIVDPVTYLVRAHGRIRTKGGDSSR